jgi:hypothetical protein
MSQIWEQGVASSNPAAPTNKINGLEQGMDSGRLQKGSGNPELLPCDPNRRFASGCSAPNVSHLGIVSGLAGDRFMSCGAFWVGQEQIRFA